MKEVSEDTREWLRQKWVRIGAGGKILGACGDREEGEGKPKCLPLAKAQSMSKKDLKSAVARKRKKDPNVEREGKAKFVATFKEELSPKEIENAKKFLIGKQPEPKPRAMTVRGLIDLHRKLHNPANTNERGPYDRDVKPDVKEEYIIEKNEPTNPKLWSQAKSLAKKKFKIYPSAYANLWASKWYKKQGGGWKTLKEDVHPNLQKYFNQPTGFFSGLLAKGREKDFYGKIVAAHQAIEASGAKSGLSSIPKGKGSSRIVLIHNNGATVVNSSTGERETSPSVVKIAYPGWADKEQPFLNKIIRDISGHILGVRQNGKEIDPDKIPHSVVQSNGTNEDGSHNITVNPNGVFPGHYENDVNNRWIHSPYVGPATHKDVRETFEGTGIQGTADLGAFLKYSSLRKEGYSHKEATGTMNISDNFSNVLNNAYESSHPELSRFRDASPFINEDIHIDNLGMMEHPFTGKKSLVVLDHGANPEIMSSYETATKRVEKRLEREMK